MNLNDFDVIMAIDPGSNGGMVAWIKGEVKAYKMPKDLTELSDLLKYYKETYNPIMFIEKLNVQRNDVYIEGGKPNMGKLFRIQQLMANYEKLKFIVEQAGIPFCLLHPYSWQSKLKIRSQIKEEKTVRKRRYAEIAQKWFPQVKVTLWNSDALLIMACGKYLIENEPKWIYSNLPEKIKETLF